jgi:aspartyl protease family protein
MGKPLFCMILFGLVIGLAWPSDNASSDAGAASPAATAEDPDPFSRDAPAETSLRRESDGHFYVNAEVNGRVVRFVVDTGASTVALTEDDARRIGLPFDPAKFRVIGQGASGDVRGASVMLSTVSVEGKKVNDVRGAIIQGGSLSLLGQSYLAALTEVSMSRDTMTLR